MVSGLPDARVLPSGANARAVTAPEWPESVPSFAPSAVFQSRTVRSSPPVAIVFPSAEIATRRTLPSCPVRSARTVLVATSQILASPSEPAVTSVLPSGVKARSRTSPTCPLGLTGSGGSSSALDQAGEDRQNQQRPCSVAKASSRRNAFVLTGCQVASFEPPLGQSIGR